MVAMLGNDVVAVQPCPTAVVFVPTNRTRPLGLLVVYKEDLIPALSIRSE